MCEGLLSLCLFFVVGCMLSSRCSQVCCSCTISAGDRTSQRPVNCRDGLVLSPAGMEHGRLTSRECVHADVHVCKQSAAYIRCGVVDCLVSGADCVLKPHTNTRAPTGKRVAIKKIKDAVEDDSDGRRLLRELKLLRHCRGSCLLCILSRNDDAGQQPFRVNTHTHTRTHTLSFDRRTCACVCGRAPGHENFIIIKDIILSPGGENFKDIYIVTDLMDTGVCARAWKSVGTCLCIRQWMCRRGHWSRDEGIGLEMRLQAVCGRESICGEGAGCRHVRAIEARDASWGAGAPSHPPRRLSSKRRRRMWAGWQGGLKGMWCEKGCRKGCRVSGV